MTHGEDPSPETHKDSAVLTYLEGLLMHPVEVGPGATASGRSEGVHCNQEQSDKVRVVFQHHSHELTAPKAGTNGPTLGSSQHLKKARLLQSGAWNESLSQPMNSAAVDLNGQRETLQNGSLEASRNAGESTLLASLLQSFSSRLQSVAMSQQSTPPSSECTSLSKAPGADKESLQLYKSAAGHLKGLMRKSKHNNHSSTPYSPRGHSQDRPPESPKSVNSSTPPSASAAAESVSCAERLKAVANMVKIRSSPTASPKPSVACSQLALLLSSEAHFQQYSKVHALKAQFSGRCASERLAAIANQQHGQDKRPLSDGRTLILRGTSSPPLLCGHSQSSSSNPLPGPNHNHNNPSREKRGFDARPTRPPQTCSSLLLLLLNNQNSQRHLTKNGHLEDNYGIFPHSCSSSVTSDSECSQRDRSLAKDNSDGESSHSSCSPMDLSVRRRAGAPDPGLKGSPPPSTVSLSSSATPSAPKVLKDKETEMRRDLKSPPKVTLMQLLLERRNTDMVNRTTDDQDLQFSSSKAANIQNQSNGLIPSKETRIKSPLDKAAAPAHALYSFSYPSNAALPSFSYLSPHVQSSPLDLCKSKPISPERAAQPAFSASKMLQNLAQSSSASPPILSSKGLVQDLDSRRPLNLLESPCATIHSTCTTPLSDRPSSCGTPSLKEDFLPSQIENLLEKRTVLQLLLGSASGTSTTSQKNTSDGCYEKSEGPSIGRSSSIEPPFGMKFKTEVTQENEESSMMYEDSGGRKESSAHEKTNSAPDFCPKVKKEPQSTDTTAKYGLLSQLLKQQSAAYYSSSAPPCEAPSQARLLREEQYHVPSPKKRRLCYRQTDISDHMHPSKAGFSHPLNRGSQGFSDPLNRESQGFSDPLNRGSQGFSDPLNRESQGFNVLKQLLLSDNCLKELSQQSHHTHGPSLLQANSTATDRHFSQPSYQQTLPHLRSRHPPGSHNSGLHLEPLLSPTTGDGSVGTLQLNQKQEPDTLIKQEPRSVDRWTSQENDEKGDSSLDSPQLSRSNPILYYMLQKGSIQLRKKVREAKGTHPESRIKEESVSEGRHYDHSLNSQTLHVKHSQESRGLS
uniref:Nuclear receptor interacting protein 1b n=1 Tax=Takifugu rubripes TaxID=31033 RepID=A0A674NVB9_TAKRU